MIKSKLLGVAVAATSILYNPAFAKQNDEILAEADQNIMSIKQASQAKDEMGVTITGEIHRQIDAANYELKDETGTISVEIDEDLATSEELVIGTKIKILGEVDKHRTKPTSIEAIEIEFLS